MIALAGLFFAVQLGEAFVQKGTWPLSTFSMYSENLIKGDQEVIFEILLSDGKKIYEMPLHQIPMDYYKGLIFLRKTFYDKDSPYFTKKDTFIKMYLHLTDFSEVAKQVNVYSVSLNQIVKDNYHWEHFQPQRKPIYTYNNHEK